MSSQWLSQLSLLSSKDPRSPQGPQAPQIHRSTEPGSSPDLLDLSYAAMQILTMLIYCFYRQLLIQHASRNVESVYSQSSYPTHSHLSATSSYAQALQHTMRKTATISKPY